MQLKYYAVKQLEAEILSIVGKYLDLEEYKVFLFGSRVSGEGDERSDIDVGIEGPQLVPIVVLEKIKEEIDNLPTLYSFDVVDFCRVSKKFKLVAEKHKEYIS